MAATTRIEWCDSTWSPISGCTPCSPGCEHCYAAALVRRFQNLHDDGTDPLDTGSFPLPFSRLQFHPGRLQAPEHWRRARRIFAGSMTDLFQDGMPDNWLRLVFHTMHCLKCEQHTFIVLTKRVKNALSWFSMLHHSSDSLWPLPNVWLGVTVCNQAEADAKMPVLLQTPAALRFVSVEPMLGPVDLAEWLPVFEGPDGHPWAACECSDCARTRRPNLDWVICGGETGPGSRPMHEAWARGLRDQCQDGRVPFFFKGQGEWAPVRLPWDVDEVIAARPSGLPHWSDGTSTLAMMRVGKKRAGALLDGREWHQFPGEG